MPVPGKADRMNGKRIRVVLVIDGFWMALGGAEHQVMRLARELTPLDIDVTILARQVRRGLPAEEQIDGLRVCRLPLLGVSPFSKLKGTIPAARWLIRNKDNYDIVHCRGHNPFEWSAMPANMLTRKPYIVQLPNPYFEGYTFPEELHRYQTGRRMSCRAGIMRKVLRPGLRLVRLRYLRRSGVVVAISPEVKQALSARNIKHVVEIPNGVDTRKFCPVDAGPRLELRRRLEEQPETQLYIFSSRLSVEKNVRTLLEAWEIFARRRPPGEVKLLILGGSDGQTFSVEAYCRELVRRRNIAAVAFKGFVDNVRDYLQAADVFVHPSLREGLSNAVLEAISCGLPVIAASGTPGNSSMIDDKRSGWLFDPHRVEDLTACLERTARDYDMRRSMGREARKIAVTKFDLSMVAGKMAELYHEIAGAGRARAAGPNLKRKVKS